MNRPDVSLTDADKGIYLKFIEWQKKSWYGVPGGEKLLPVIAAKYTSAEAEFLTGIPFSPKNLDVLSELKGMERAALGARLDELTRKGLLYKFDREGVPHYMLNDIFMLMRATGWPGRTDEHSKQFAVMSDNYFPAFMEPWETVTEKGLRELTNKTSKVSELNIDLCIGCGVCAYKCQSKSLSLVRNDADHHPPRTGRDWAVEFMSTRKAV